MMRIALISCLLLIAVDDAHAAEKVTPLPKAHAHNDYHHDVPLGNALQHGFCSVEADVFLVDGELLVGHSRDELRPERTLENLYLAPLQERIENNGGRVYRDGPEFTLLIDFKNDGKHTYAALRKLLKKFAPMLTSVTGDQIKRGAVTIVISGDRPQKAIAADKMRHVGIDGRLSDLDSTTPAHLMPMISDRWGAHFRWKGNGNIPAAEKQKLDRIVNQTHASGRTVRFWATPENPQVWRVLFDAGVDHINTDDLPGLQTFLLKQQ
jgi:hypothetical protein